MNGRVTLGRFIAARRKFMRLTQKELAKQVGVSKSAIAKWETDGGLPERDNLKKLSEAMNVTVDDLLGMTDERHIPEKNPDVNITPDLIAALESYGYRVIRPDNSTEDGLREGTGGL